ncbi:TPA: hypothetical protein ACIE98_000986 [Citrobacter koseri]|uniref:hypothetical protein n=1 Tax=Citrobacter koseri TaxID=545 RepID=UPI00190210D6|nr:hypothetical protein [Citrobacter koseri]MBJ8985269.1 hypothetical protein [Citrobacter koseri]MBJ9009653.1 hypothetical protein [Citrobacter koseri]MBJ9280249.1 hypothetical protein [Citrobacter koseri]HAT3722488.1 hypothetical protein [Citrobacter koseri]HAT3927760.1 hypothetical protein [Citrobacter koseri]
MEYKNDYIDFLTRGLPSFSAMDMRKKDKTKNDRFIYSIRQHSLTDHPADPFKQITKYVFWCAGTLRYLMLPGRQTSAS